MNKPLFGTSLDPAVSKRESNFAIARLADQHGLDLLLLQDHPYNKEHLDSWTLLTALAAQTGRVHVGTNVANVPLRTPMLLAKMAASLDVITGGRFELGIGAGTFWSGIAAYGGRDDLQDRPFTAFKEALAIIRGFWQHAGGRFSFDGDVYSVERAVVGPAPAHDIRIWVGGYGPKMLALTGEQADGISVSTPYIPYRELADLNRQIDAAATAAGRSPDAIRRLYNLIGTITSDGATGDFESKVYSGTREQWVDHLVMLYRDYRQDSLIFYPSEGDPEEQLTIYATEIVPAVKQALA